MKSLPKEKRDRLILIGMSTVVAVAAIYFVVIKAQRNSAEALSKSPQVGSDGRLQGGALLPANAANYRRMLLTRETSERPTHPGPIVLSGAFALH